MFRWHIIFPNSLHHIWSSGSERVAKTLRLISKRIALPLSYLSLDSIQVWQAGLSQFFPYFSIPGSFFILITSFLWLEEQTFTTLSFLCSYFGDRNKAQRENYSLESLILEADVDVYLWKKLIVTIINIIKCKCHPFIYYYRDKLFCVNQFSSLEFNMAN